MGANNAKPSSEGLNKVLSVTEKSHILELYNSISEPKVANLRILWNGKLDRHLEELIINYLQKSSKTTTFSFNDFEMLFAHLGRGTVDEKSDILINMLTNWERTKPIPRKTVLQYFESVIKSYILLNADSGWRNSSPGELNSFSESICGDLSSNVTPENLCAWISSTPNLSSIHVLILGRLYDLQTPTKQRLVPTCDNKRIPSILDISSVMFLNAALPAALRNEWRILFSSAKHGESFSKIIGLIVKKGPTILVVRDKNGYVFGGFAPKAWMIGPNYLGDETSFLFQVKPTMQIYSSTHYNDHYQYLNTQQQTMPNGLGMGGQFGYWGLWIDAEYGIGHSSETCTTYSKCKMLSATKNFKIDHLEVWAVGPLPEIEHTTSERSILDTNTEAKALLEMAGKTRHSDGLRKPEEEDD